MAVLLLFSISSSFLVNFTRTLQRCVLKCYRFLSSFHFIPFLILLIYKCINRDTRSPVLEESLRNLGVEKLSKDDVQKMQWEVLEAKIGNWIHFMRIAVSFL